MFCLGIRASRTGPFCFRPAAALHPHCRSQAAGFGCEDRTVSGRSMLDWTEAWLPLLIRRKQVLRGQARELVPVKDSNFQV